MEKWIIKNSNEIFNRRIFSLKDLECYHPEKSVNHNFFIMETYDWINVVARTKDKKFVMVKQHRLGTDEITIETPGGITEKAESPADSVLRELLEETGYKPEKLYLLKKLSANPAILTNYIYFYFASECSKISEQNLDAAEDIDVLTYSIEEIIDMVKQGQINHSVVITAITLYLLSEYCENFSKRIII